MLYDIWHRESIYIKGSIRTSLTLDYKDEKYLAKEKHMVIGSARISICDWIIRIKCVPSFYCRLTFQVPIDPHLRSTLQVLQVFRHLQVSLTKDII